MLYTHVCDLLQIEVPIIQAGMGGNVTSAELAAAVTNAGALGSIGAGSRPAEDVRRHLSRLADLTSGSFAISHMVTILDEEAFRLTLAAAPRVITFALADGGDYIARAHDVGSLVMQQVCTVAQAEAAVEHGADIIIAQGGEAGGFGGTVSTIVLVPQVVDAVSPVPVIAAGGLSDGRGLAAALMLGAQGINIGTRFLASEESLIHPDHKQAIAGAASENVVKTDFFNAMTPLPGGAGYVTTPRAIRSAFIDEWRDRPDEVREQSQRLFGELIAAGEAGRQHELFPWAGQSAGGIGDVRPAADIVREIAAQAEALLAGAASFVS